MSRRLTLSSLRLALLCLFAFDPLFSVAQASPISNPLSKLPNSFLDE